MMSEIEEGSGSLSAEARFRHYLAEGRPRIQQCAACRRHIHPPRELCPHCGAVGFLWPHIGGGGAVYSHTTVNRKADAGGPYNVSLIDLDEGVRMMSRVEGLPPDEVSIGMRVRARVSATQDGHIVLFERERE